MTLLRQARRLLAASLSAALVAGTLDMLFACTFWGLHGVHPSRIMQSVAAGVLGPSSFEGGAGTAALGLGLHYAITLAMAAVYFAAAWRLALLRQRPWLCGGLYGLVLFAVMQNIVLPLSVAGPSPDDPAWVLSTMAAHVLLVGIPIAWMARDGGVHSRFPAPGALR